MGMDRLKAGIIGIGGYGAAVLAELGRNDLFVVAAIADQNRELAEQAAREHEAVAYDDYRSLIVQEDLDVLFLALPTFLCGECIQLAAKKPVHVFKEAPLARTLPEATEWVRLMKKCGRQLGVGAPKRFAPGYLEAHLQVRRGQIGEVYLIRAETFVRHDKQFGWRGDPVLAGGGVLLEMAYHMIDQMSWDMGPPERVYSLHAMKCSKQALPPYRTEDSTVVLMSFAEGAMGNVVCGWMTDPQAERLVLHGTDGTIEADANSLEARDSSGQLVQQETYDVDDRWLIAQQIRQFGDSLVDAEVKPTSTGQEHLVNVAIVESAYLSGRTQLSETLQVYGSVFEI